ncbi:MAG TPA: haloacid dehalogenase type II [Bryobacteraceae bacterium]|jgi:2-haloacid dehalogenase
MIKAILFDVFGTVVDWRGSIIAEGVRRGIPGVDWARFADGWRAGYAPSMERVRRGELPWTKLDGLHRMTLDGLLEEFGLAALDEEDRDHWNRVWHRLTPWPDSVAGLEQLRQKYTIAPLSNGNVSLLTEMAKRAALPWDLILSAELSRHYKPDPEVYLYAVELLSLEPSEVVMAAAHRVDLEAARRCGLRTAFVHRPAEHGVGSRAADSAEHGEFDFVAADILDLAAKLALADEKK